MTFRRRHRVCPRCHFIGHPHLCNCTTAIGEALGRGDVGRAQALYTAMVEAARKEEEQ